MSGAVEAFRAWTEAQPPARGARGVAALVEGVVAATPKQSWLLVGRREAGAALLRGADADRLAQARPYRVVPAGDAPAARALQAVGIALAGSPAVCLLGAGSTSYGDFHEALHLCAQHRAPVVFVIAWYEGDGPFAPQLAVRPEVLAQALGLGAARCDGADAAAVRAAVASVGAGPAVVVADMPHG